MDAGFFHTSFADIVDLNNSEGPNYNIFEPKFEARKQMQQLMETIVNVYKSAKSWLAVRQMCSCLAFVGTTMMEVEEEEEGMLEVRKAYALLQLCAAEADGAMPKDLKDVTPVTLDEILAAEAVFLRRDLEFVGCVEFVRVHNAAGLYLSKRDSEHGQSNTKKVLLRAEAAYKEWNEWFLAQPGAPQTKDLPVGGNGRLDMDKLGDGEQRSLGLRRFEMDSAYINTLFFFAQVYSSLQEPSLATRYCHLTMYYQLLCKAEFDRKVWAGNALNLGEFYSSSAAYGQALHCLRAGELMMPKENPDETTRGLVAQAYGRFHLSRLVHYRPRRDSSQPADPPIKDFVSYWVDFPVDGLEPATDMAPLETFEDARKEFKEGNAAFEEGLRYHPFETACTSHIELLQSISKLYEALDAFENDRSRRIAMLQRRVNLLRDFPDKLSFNAYPIVVRQLLYDLGSLSECMILERKEQRSGPLQPGEKPLTDKAFNSLVSAAKRYYTRFIETWRSPQTGEIPAVLDEDSRLPFFRVLMRLAHLETSSVFHAHKDRYDAIGRSKDAYQRAIDFVKANEPLADGAQALIEQEIRLAKDMVKLLVAEQQSVWLSYQRSLSQ